jgi:O-antigen/teichoic acid export membrane protein
MNIAKIKDSFKNSPVLRNFSLLTVSNIFTQVLGITTTIKMARFANTTAFFTYNLLQVHVAVFVAIASLGLNNVVVRMVSRDRLNSKKIFITSLILKAAILLISILIYVIYYSFFVTSYGSYPFLLTILSVIFISLNDNVEGVAFGLERMEFSSVISFAVNLLWIIILLLVPGKFYTLNVLFEIYFILFALKTTVYVIALNKAKCLTGVYNNKDWKDSANGMLQQALPFYYLALLTIVSNQVPVLFLEHRAGVEQVGFFNIANKLLSPMNLVLSTALISLFPNLAKLFIENNELFLKRIKSIFLIISLLGIMGAFAVTFFRSEVVMLIYGKKYINSALVLSYQCWYMCLYALVCLIGTLLGAIDRQKELSYLAVICTSFQVPILWFGAKYGAEYLSAAFLAATVLVFILHVAAIIKFLNNAIKIWFFIKIFLFLAVAYTISVLIPAALSLSLKSVIFASITVTGLLIVKQKIKVVKG